MILAHTDCRMTNVSEDQLHATIAQTHGLDTRSLDFGAITDQRAVLTRDVQRFRSFPYLPSRLAVIGCEYNLGSGRVEVLVP
jgi:carbonic anhydrase